MKTKYLLTLCASMLYSSLFGQDIIFLRTADEIEAKVIEITNNEVKYRTYGNDNSPLRIIAKNDIFYIKYETGVKDIFEQNDQSGHSTTTSSPALNDDCFICNYPYPKVERSYSVGEFVSINGVGGIVIHTTDGGHHGLIMSLTNIEEPVAWFDNSQNKAIDIPKHVAIGCFDKEDGWVNMQHVAKLIDAKNNGLRWSNFPAFNRCRSLGDGWYLPSQKELQIFLHNNAIRKLIDNELISRGYFKISDCTFISSTETDYLYKSKAYHVYIVNPFQKAEKDDSINGILNRNLTYRDFSAYNCVAAYHKF